jgi:methionyl-tRNA formyltransferase
VRLVFLGTPEMAVPELRALVAAGHDVVLVVTRRDTRRGRGSGVSASPVKAAATELGIPVTDDIDDVLAIDADLGVVVAYGRLIQPHILEHLPMINVHFSLLPRWRGAAPVERALLAGDERTGVCIMDVERGLDTGAVYAREEVPIGPRATADELRATLVDVGTRLLVDVLSRPLGKPEPQHGHVTYANKIEPFELELDWTCPAAELDRWVRVGGAWTTLRDRRLKVLGAEPASDHGERREPGELAPDGTVGTGDGTLRLDVVQPEGKGPMSWTAFANGARPQPGERLGPEST